ncbi:MAG: NCS2 family permease, partial [Clostridia bacterium]|nr:NCS2 family permease [Clostridia bacterium]
MSEETKDEVVSEQPEVQAEATAEAPAPDGTVAETQSPHKGFLGKVDNWFGITKSKSSYKAEIIAGLTTFMAMVYILIVNPSIFVYADGVTIPGLSFDAMYIATSLGAIVGTMLMALLAKMPLAQASGMGVNAFVVYNLVGGGLTYANAMVFTLLDGVIFIILTVTGLRKYIFTAIPDEVKKAINVGLGLFIAFIGLQNAGVIVNSDSTLVGLVSFNMLKLKDLFNPSYLVTFSNGTVGGMLPAF